jgi:hypothetical protein
MDKLEEFARKHNLRLNRFAAGEYDIHGREGCIRVIDNQLGIQLDDQACIPGKARDGCVKVGVFNPDDAVNYACDVTTVAEKLRNFFARPN